MKVSVEQVHKEFFTAGERLLEEAKTLINKTISEKANRLKALGFSKSQDVQKANEWKVTEEVVAIIEKYALSHPMNKVITERQVKSICEKYDLVMGDIGRYKGFVPEKNLKEIEAFNANLPKQPKSEITFDVGAIEDVRIEREDVGFGGMSSVYQPRTIYDFRIRDTFSNQLSEIITRGFWGAPSSTFQICAPIKDMDTTGTRVKDRKIVVPDPVVLWPIEKTCYLIVTAWGDEASDPDVVNQKHN